MENFRVVESLTDEKGAEQYYDAAMDAQGNSGEIAAKRITRAVIKLAHEKPIRPPEPPTDNEIRRAAFEQKQQADIREDIVDRIAPSIRQFLLRLDDAGRLRKMTVTNTKITNEKLLAVLSNLGYITPEMAEAKELDINGIIAGQLLTDKKLSKVNKQVLVGPHRNMVRDIIDEEVLNYIVATSREDIT